MLIRANLYAQTLEQAQSRRLHPARFAVAAGLVLGVAALLYWINLGGEVARLRTSAAAARAERTALQARLALARERHTELTARIKRREQLLALAKRRFNWGPVMEKLFASVPANVQLQKLILQDGGGKAVISMEGSAWGNAPREESEQFRSLLVETFLKEGGKAQFKFTRLEDAADETAARFAIAGTLEEQP